MVFILVTILVTIAFLVYNHFTKYNNYWKDRNVPGPTPTFFFGNIKDLFLRRRTTGEIFKEICDEYPDEKCVGIFRMRTPDLIVKDLDIIKAVLIKDFNTFVDRGVEFSEKDLGANLFHANGDTWRVLRNRFTPLYTVAKLKKMMCLMNKPANMLADHIEQIIKVQTEQEIHGIVKKFSQANLAACIFGLDIDSFETQDKALRQLEKKFFNISYSADLEMMYPGILKKIGGSLFPKVVQKFFFTLTRDLIAKKDGKLSNRNNFVDLIVELKKSKQISAPIKDNNSTEKTLTVTDEVLAAQAFIFFTAGYESSAVTMSFMLYQLALNPEIQDKVVAELQEVFEKHNGEYTLEAISDLKYMGKVLDETLRMYPAVDNIRRSPQVDYKIPGTDITLKKGQIVIIPVNVIHRDARYYSKPEVFDPERFSPENKSNIHYCAFLPFGEGPRQCLGYRFALVQSKVCIAKILTKYRVEPSENTPKQFKMDPHNVVMYPVGGIPLRLFRRH